MFLWVANGRRGRRREAGREGREGLGRGVGVGIERGLQRACVTDGGLATTAGARS